MRWLWRDFVQFVWDVGTGGGEWRVLSARFLSKEKENAYAASQEKHLLISYFLCGSLGLSATLTNLLLDHLKEPTQALWITTGVNIVWCIIFCSFLLVAAIPPLHSRVGVYRLEVLMALFMALTFPSWVFTDTCAANKILGANIPDGIVCQSDSRLLLGLDALATVQFIGVRIRWYMFLPASILALCSYYVYLSIFGSPEQTIDLPILSGLWAILVLGSSIGKRMIEQQQRAHFSNIIEERSRRYEVEYRLERSKEHGLSAASKTRDAESVSQASFPTTTNTGRLFPSYLSDLDALSQDRLEKVIDLGIKEHWLIGAEDLHIKPSSFVGEGSFSTVVTADYFGATVAVKIPSSSRKHMYAQRLCLLVNELRVLRQVRHPSLVHFIGAYINPTCGEVFLVLEYISGSCLEKVLRGASSLGSPSTKMRYDILRQVSSGLRYLHGLRPSIVHGDLKPANVLVQVEAVLPDEKKVQTKICDFGLSKVLTKTAESFGGSFIYQAPELICGAEGHLSSSVDVFALGRLFFAVITGRKPLQTLTKTHVIQMARRGQVPELNWPQACPRMHETMVLSSKCLQFEQSLRPDMLEVYDGVLSLCAALDDEAERYGSEQQVDLLKKEKDAMNLRLPHFRETSMWMRELTTVTAMERWNVPVGVGSCCSYHSYCDALDEVCKNLKVKKCPRGFGSYADWQCSNCFALAASDEVECEVCGERSSTRCSSVRSAKDSSRLPSISEYTTRRSVRVTL